MKNPPPRLGDTVHVSDGVHCVAAIIAGDTQDGRRVLQAFINGGLGSLAAGHSPAPQIIRDPAGQVENTYHAIGECPWQR